MIFLNSSGKPAYLLQVAIVSLTVLLPCLAGFLLFRHAFPFYLKGPQFLLFYSLHMTLGMMLLYLYRNTAKSNSLRGLLLATGLLLSFTRICQGCYHHKPVLFLVLLTAGYLLLLCRNTANPSKQPAKT